MRHFKLCFLLLIILTFSDLLANELKAAQNFSQSEELICRQFNKRYSVKSNRVAKRSRTKPTLYSSSTQAFQTKKSLFFQTNIGAGFLYFSGLRGNLMGQPSINFITINGWRDAPLKGRLTYNSTPLFEYLLGYNFTSWLKLAISYQHQGGVTIQSKALLAYPVTALSFSQTIQFTSNLSLDALLAKVYFELPYAFTFKSLATSPYLAIGAGSGWQSWTRVQINYMLGNTGIFLYSLPLRQKISANAVWMLDLGFHIQSAYPNSKFSVLLGCKYNQWGQARSIGKMSQQGAHKLALTQPLRIKTVYQFAPYLGVQWSFSNTYTSKASNTLKGKNPNTRLPYWAKVKSFQSPKALWTQFNTGIGFLYFSGLRGNLMGQPVLNFDPVTGWRDVPLKGRLSYNRTPLFEYLLGYRFNSWFKLALSYQYQGGVTIQTKALFANPVNNDSKTNMAQFTSNLSLNALLFKLYLELPYAFIFKNFATNPYLAVGVGPGWQSWTRIQTHYMLNNVDYESYPLPLRQKISANAVWMIDLGFRIQRAYPGSKFSVLLGCKYNQWGQARSMGGMNQQGAHKLAITQPLRIKTVYQFAPYLGVQWDFPHTYISNYSYTLQGKRPNPWLPYWGKIRDFQSPKALWTQFNTGIGFLYFSGLRGNLMGQPVLNFDPVTGWRDVPLKGRLSYNRTPLFEYLLGYRFNSWFKLALSYQYQGGITIQSKALSAYLPTYNAETVQFTSNLSLNALLAKVYLELPYTLIFRSVATSPYLAAGIGPGWQSWTAIQVDYMGGLNAIFFSLLPLRQKISANAVWMLDAGFRIQSAYPNSKFSILLGCKYNQWGQARNIGEMTQQGSHKLALSQPLRIKTVYQFAPYLGVQWNF